MLDPKDGDSYSMISRTKLLMLCSPGFLIPILRALNSFVEKRDVRRVNTNSTGITCKNIRSGKDQSTSLITAGRGGKSYDL